MEIWLENDELSNPACDSHLLRTAPSIFPLISNIQSSVDKNKVYIVVVVIFNNLFVKKKEQL